MTMAQEAPIFDLDGGKIRSLFEIALNECLEHAISPRMTCIFTFWRAASR